MDRVEEWKAMEEKQLLEYEEGEEEKEDDSIAIPFCRIFIGIHEEFIGSFPGAQCVSSLPVSGVRPPPFKTPFPPRHRW